MSFPKWSRWLGIVSASLLISPAVPALPEGAPSSAAESSAAKSSDQPPAGMTQVKLDGQTFTLPEGFSIERVAGTPLVERPIVADFDERGRLYVADSSGSNEKVDVQLQKKPHRIVRLEDTDGDGRYDRSQVFADKMMFPEGVMWHAGSLYVAAPPHIWKLTDTNDDGVADRREIWFDGKTLTGCANDLHGPYRGPDGWVYWCKGAFAEQKHTLPGGKQLTTRASHIFRARPDGTGIEPVMTGGMDNPVDVAFTPGGERIFTTTFLQHPGGGRRDGLIHAIYGGIYGKDHDPIHAPDHKWTSPHLMPVLTHLGPAAPCGLHRLESGQFGTDAAGKPYRDNLFACQFNLRKVSRHILKASGSTFTTEDSDFLVSDHHDFHPTDVIEDADGSLLVVNTGGWYKLCCPSSQLVKADVLGAIYRIRRLGAHKIEDPRGEKISWTRPPDGLARYLGDRRPVVRRRAIEAAAARDAAAVAAVSQVLKNPKVVPEARADAVWTLCRIDHADARAATREALVHEDTVLSAALHSIAIWRDRDAVPALVKLLASPNPTHRRQAAEALGRIGDASAVSAIFAALGDDKTDHSLEHTLTYSLIEIGQEKPLRQGLNAKSPRTRRAALVALDQTGASLDVQLVLSLIRHDDADLRDSARWVATRHPEWGNDLVGYLRGQLAKVGMTDQEGAVIELVAPFAKSDTVQKMLAEAVRDSIKSPPAASVAVKSMAASGLKEAPVIWVDAWVNELNREQRTNLDLHDLLAAARTMSIPKSRAEAWRKALIEVCERQGIGDSRLAAMAAVPSGLPSVTSEQFELLMKFVDDAQPAQRRGSAADALGRAKLNSQQLRSLAERLDHVGPLEIDRVLSAFAQSGDEEVGRALLAKLIAPRIRQSLRVDSLKPRLAKFGPAVQAEAEKLYVLINGELAQQQTRLNETAASLPAGDIRRGQAVFNSAKNSCLACHTIGYVGGKIGPDLTRIGGIRTERDLLESILFPSASFVRSYEPLAVRTTDGRTLQGILKKDAADEIILIEAADKEHRIPRGEIEAVQPGRVSVMPAGLDKQLSPQELADLVAFLRACK